MNRIAASGPPIRLHRDQRPGSLLVAATLLAVSCQAVASDGTGIPRVIPPHANFRGLNYGEWAAQWWSSLFLVPVVDGYHPIFTGGAFAVEKGVLFLSPAYYAVGVPPIDVTVAAGTAIFVPVISFECSVIEPDPAHGDNEAELRACANGHIDQTSGLFAVIDGVAVENLDNYRVESPLFEFGPLPEDNVLEAVYGGSFTGTSLAVDAGVYLLLAPLSVGTHTIHVGGTYEQFQFSADTTFNITVVPRKP